ncbi:MAG TPA: site-specific integrase [Dehalococcoidia bacterium]|nr:site-specific integrase [Dehalococcoidia bacterium]
MMPSIQNKGGDNWLLVVSNGFDSSGKRLRPTKMFKGTEKKAWVEAILFEEEVKNGKYCPASKDYKLSKFVEVWIKDYGEKQLAPKTLARYKEMLDKRILPAIGHMRLDKIKPMTINRLMNDLSEAPRLDKKEGHLSPRTIKHHFRCLSAILQDAVEWEVIKSNPCFSVKPPRATKARVKVYDENETNIFLTALKSAPLKHRTLIWLEIATGVREGEIMGLEWADIDFENNTVKIERAGQYLPSKGIFTKDPKNEESKRILALPNNVMELLKQYKAHWNKRKLKLGDKWKKSERLFVTWDGRPGTPTWPGSWLTKFLEKNNLPHCSFHSLRHLNATMLIKAGIPLKNVSERLGHTDIGTTANIYTEALKSVDREAAKKISVILENKPKKDNKKKRIKK